MDAGGQLEDLSLDDLAVFAVVEVSCLRVALDDPKVHRLSGGDSRRPGAGGAQEKRADAATFQIRRDVKIIE